MSLLEDNQRLREERDLLRRRLAELEEEFARSNQEVFEMNEALVQMNARLSALDRMKDTFLSMITHELRTPMTAMIGLAENLEAGVYGPLNETQTENLRKIIESGGRLRQLVNDLLDLSKMEAGAMRLQREPLDPRSLVEAVIYQLESLAEAGAVKLINRVGYDLPEVDCDGQRIEQVLTNLISNALKFTPPQGTVTITATVQDQFVIFTVADTGCGIPPESLAHIFDKFIQLHPNRDDRTKGTGLGLAIVRHLVELHGGTVGVESVVERGSRFSFSLPISAQ
ncbi:MAG TPA: HAMP domain-containing sensor histidine kinase [Blastocatellia bacterium]|nr:HAMP domain-containing sensor histidine kinase [Blastocatellia bacterium]